MGLRIFCDVGGCDATVDLDERLLPGMGGGTPPGWAVVEADVPDDFKLGIMKGMAATVQGLSDEMPPAAAQYMTASMQMSIQEQALRGESYTRHIRKHMCSAHALPTFRGDPERQHMSPDEVDDLARQSSPQAIERLPRMVGTGKPKKPR